MAMYCLHVFHSRDVTKCIADVDSDNLPEAGDRICDGKYQVTDVRDAELESERNVIVKDYQPPEPIIKQRAQPWVKNTRF